MDNLVGKQLSKTRNTGRAAVTLLLAILLFLSGCNALKRGDLGRQVENTLYFTEFGFTVADNPVLLSRNAMASVNSSETDLYLSIPYYDAAGTTPLDPSGAGTPLVVHFNTVGDGTQVDYYNDGTSTWIDDIQSGVNTVEFHNTDVSSPVQFRISKTNVFGGYEEVYFWVYMEKLIRPAIDQVTYNQAPTIPIQLSFVDEYGNPIPLAADTLTVDPMDLDNSGLDYDSRYIVWINGPSIQPFHYDIDLQLRIPGEHTINIKDGGYVDSMGYPVQAGTVVFTYEPPAVRLSQSGSDWLDFPGGTPNNGLEPNPPVQTWPVAVNSLIDNGLFDINITASSTPYDVMDQSFIVAGGALGYMNTQVLDTLPTFFRIYGGWNESFTSQYDGDWGSRPQTILVNSTQADGNSSTDPSAVLTLQNIDNNHVFDHLVLGVADDLNDSTALRIQANATPILHEITAFASQGTGSTAALTVLSNAAPLTYSSRFIGKDDAGSSGRSIGVRLNGANLEIHDQSFILGGDIASGQSYGIWSDGASNFESYNCFIGAGVVDPGSDRYIEGGSWGIYSEDTQTRLINTWVYAGDASSSTKSIEVSNTSAATIEIEGCTLVSGDAESTRGIDVVDGDSSAVLYLYNSVVIAGTSTGDGDSWETSYGVSLNVMHNTMPSRISGNAIYVKDSYDPTPFTINTAVGIALSSTPNKEIHNNLIWSNRASDLVAVESTDATGTFPLRNNDFWDTSGPVEVQMNAADGLVLPSFYQNDYRNAAPGAVLGNISVPVSVDTTFNFGSDWDVGRITSSIPEDVVYGGEDLSGIIGGITPPIYDRDGPSPYGRDRTASFGSVGVSIGPYEYGDDFYAPWIVYVHPSGDDGHPIGSASRPFATLARAYDAAREGITQPTRWEVYEIRVAAGDYDIGTDGTTYDNTLQNFTNDIEITGGWNGSYSSRTYGASTLFSDSEIYPMLTITGNTVTNGFLFSGFTVENRHDNNATAGGTMIHISTLAAPRFERNTVRMANTTTVSGISRGIQADVQAAPIITGNTISGRSAEPLLATTPIVIDYQAIYLDGTSASTYIAYNTDIYGGIAHESYAIHATNNALGTIENNNSIRGGGSNNPAAATDFYSGGILLSACDGNASDNIRILNNTITGGSTTDPFYTSYGMEVIGSSGTTLPVISGNTIMAGNVNGDSIGMLIDSSNLYVISGNTISGGNAPSSIGMDVKNGSSTTVDSNTIVGGNATTSIGLRSDGSSGSYSYNDIRGTATTASATATSTGVDIRNLGTPSFTLNDINAGETSGAGGYARGVSIMSSTPSLTNNTITGGIADDTEGIYITTSAPTIENNYVYGGMALNTASHTSIGINIFGGGGTIKGNTFDGGAGYETTGLLKNGTDAVSIESNRILGGDGVGQSIGAHLISAAGTDFFENSVFGGSSQNSRGMIVENNGAVNVYNNDIYGGSSTSDSIGVYLDDAQLTVLYNNRIHGGDVNPDKKRGVYITNGAAAVSLINNTIYSGRSTGNVSNGLEFDGTAQPVILNNIIISGLAATAGESVTVYQNTPNIPGDFRYNLLLSDENGATAYNRNGTIYDTAGDIDLLGFSPHYVDIAGDPSEYFIRFSAFGNEGTFQSDNWRLPSGGTAIHALESREGGIDPGTFALDKDGNLRTDPWSIGAYERD